MIALIVVGCLCGAIGAATSKKESPPPAPPTIAASPEPKPVATTAPAPRPSPPAVQVSAAQLLVTGAVSNIRKDFMDDIVLDLRTSNPFTSVNATMDDGEKVTCDGGGMLMESSQFRNCVLD